MAAVKHFEPAGQQRGVFGDGKAAKIVNVLPDMLKLKFGEHVPWLK